MCLPRVMIAGLAGGTGKTLVSVGLIRALAKRGLRVAAFKKGPDFIDAEWLGAASGNPSTTLDSFLMSRAAMDAALAEKGSADIAIIEGNRGVFDGFDARGTHSSAELARTLRAPVLLVIDVTKSTRTIAALVLGCRALDPEFPLAGVILNRLGTARQERLIREALALVSDVPIVGAIPRLSVAPLPSRHLGLVMPAERQQCDDELDHLAETIAGAVDLATVRRIAEAAPAFPHIGAPPICAKAADTNRPRIGVLRDAAFCFYYSENLAALEQAGATLVPISPIHETEIPDIDALYAGGGYPEEHAGALADNRAFRAALAALIREDLPVWAECGGLMYLAKALVRDGRHYPMVGALPIVVEHTPRPQAHGYVEAHVDNDNAYWARGVVLHGHEFHHSHVIRIDSPIETALALDRGVGIGGGRDGIIANRVFASYMHLLATGVPDWAPAFVRLARESRAQRTLTSQEKEGHRGIHLTSRREDRCRRRWLHPGT